MASIILTNWTVYYSTDATAGNGYKQIRWTGAGTPQAATNTVNELYSALSDLFSISTQNVANATIPMLAVTPTVYTIGAFDAGDLEPWFIDPISVQHLTGGSLQSVNWSRDLTARTGSRGIVRIPRSGSSIVSDDVGATITNTTSGDTGTLLYVETSYLWIRPTDNLAANDWDSGGTTDLSCNGHTTDDQTGASTNGERLWANIYSIGTLEENTNLIVYQNFSQITSFWSAGHIDRLFLVNDGFASGLIDYGYLTVYARQYTKLYDHYTAGVSAGGRNPIPLSTSDDINNTTGYRTFTAQTATGNGTFNAGNYIYVGASWAAATKKGVLTAVGGTSGTNSTPILTYYLVGDYSDFTDGNAIVEYDPNTGANGDASCTASDPTNTGPLTTPSSSITIVFGSTLQDLGNNNGSRPYSVTIDCAGATVLQMYERLKYLTRNGQITDIDTGSNQSIIGQQYSAIGDLYLPYDTGSIDNPFSEVGGEPITATGSFTSTLTSKHDRGTNEGFIIVRNTRGTTPINDTTLTGSTSGNTALVDTDAGADPVGTITAYKTAPFGTFAGGTFFGARGVWITNYDLADSNNFELIDSNGTPQSPPLVVVLTVNGVKSAEEQLTHGAITGGDNAFSAGNYLRGVTSSAVGTIRQAVDGTHTVIGEITGTFDDDEVVNETTTGLAGDDTGDSATVSAKTTKYVRCRIEAKAGGDLPIGTQIMNEQAETSYGSEGYYKATEVFTYTNDQPVLVRARYRGYVPFETSAVISSSDLTVTAIWQVDTNYREQ